MTPEPIVLASANRPAPIVRFSVSVVLILVVYFASGILYGLFGASTLFRPFYSSVFLALLLGGFFALLYALDQVRSRLSVAVGLPLGRYLLLDAAVGMAFGIVAVSLCVGLIAIVGSMHFHSLGAHPAALLLTLWTLAAAAMGEELIFRGYPLHRLMEAVGVPAAVAIMSGVFGVAHLRNPNASLLGAVNTAEIGVLFGLAYVRTRSLWLPFGIHFGWNLALGLGYGLTVSGYSDFSVLVEGIAIGPRWLTGAEYGIEASATVTLIVLLMIVILLKLIPQRPAPELVVGVRPQPPSIFPESHRAPGTRIQ